MGRLFDYDGPFMRVVNRLGNLIWLGILTTIFCIPVLTAGASLTAMYYTVFKMRDKDRGYVWENFWNGFRTNFLQATGLWLLTLLGFCVFYGDYVVLTKSIYTFPIIYKVLTGLVIFIFVMTCAFVFPLQARFENTWKQVIKNSFLMGMFHLPKTILVVFLHIMPYVILRFYPVTFPAVLALGLSGPAYFNAALFLSVFRIYSPAEAEEETAETEESSTEESSTKE